MLISKIPSVFKEIGSVNSTIKKVELMKKYKNLYFQKIFSLAYDPHITFGVTKIDLENLKYNPKTLNDEWLCALIALLENLSERNLTGNQARNAIREIIESSNEEWKEVIINILNKDLRMGAGIKLINKVYPGLLPEEFCMLAVKLDFKRIKFPVYVDTKLDGLRGVVKVRNGTPIIYSRSGKVLKNYKNIEREFSNLPDGDYDGEITIGHFQDVMRTVTRKVDGEEMGAKAIFNIFDIPDTTKKEKLWQRLIALDALFGKNEHEHIVFKKGKTVYTEEEIMEFYNEQLALGNEGAMIKDLSGLYEYKRSFNWMKLKPSETEDLKIVGVEEGTGKNIGKLGAFVCILPNGKTVNVGYGYKDHERKEYWDKKEELIGKMIEIKYQEKTRDGIPRFGGFVRFRPDKD